MICFWNRYFRIRILIFNIIEFVYKGDEMMKLDLFFEILGGYGIGYDKVLICNDESRNL